ncbi:hypothetical protein B0I08_104277 [Glaciihabitans tibetensis]|uniref:Uncharacterized protein n=1 Tax=Glaciihabitans tibetensis TaxID=1266600 RepID=A0A2T0VEI1_9MICO|nr:hypothetical protein [Glaciihabitans tibetensis]PRY68574.1 hypothetical protein B0I08_104277 [Glaciihabitans tibetensis]
MFTILTRAARLVAARWPVLLAWYLAGWLARYLLIELAATFGATSALAGLLIMPLAILARLASYIAMFLTLREAMPAFTDLRSKGEDAVDRAAAPEDTALPDPRGRVQDIFLVTIVPFFAFYAAWQLLADDTIQYAQSALSKVNVFDDRPGGRPLELELNVASISVIVIAYAGRYLLKRYASRLPRWTNLVAVYLESVWVYLTLFLISTYTKDLQGWVASRTATQTFDEFVASIAAAFAPLGVAMGGLEWAVAQAGGLLLFPIAWLTLAGIVYGRALAKPKVAFPTTHRYYTGARSRIQAVPQGVRRRAKDIGADFVGRWTPLANALVLIWKAGVLPMGLFVLAHTVLESATTWLLFAGVRIIGPHDLVSWWMHFDGMLLFAVNVILEPLQICLIAAAYDFCLRRLEERREDGADLEPKAEVAG